MNQKQQQRLRKSCVAIVGPKVVQRGEFDRVCDQVLKPTLERFATQAIYLGLHLAWQHAKPKAPPALKLEISFKDLARRLDAALRADGARLRWKLEGDDVLPQWRPRMRTLTPDQLLDGLLDLIALLEPVDTARPQDAQEAADAGARRTRRTPAKAG